MVMSQKKNLLERLNNNEVLIGDGGFVFALEKRGYVKAGPWTPEVCVEHPDAVRQLHREFLRAGSDIMQAFTFYASDDKLSNRGNEAQMKHGTLSINRAACELARSVAMTTNETFWLGGISQTPTYLNGGGEEATKNIFRQQVALFHEEGADFVLCEYFEHLQEAIWALEVCKEYGFTTAVTMCIGPYGDLHRTPIGQCGIELIEAGADVIGLNCHFDPFITLKSMKLMKNAIENAELKAHYMTQPLGYMTPDAGRQGFIDLPEFPFALEPRICTRFDAAKYAREAYDMGIRIIGGCCGFEPYHIRAIAEELAPERGFLPESSEKHIPWGGGLTMHTKPWVRARGQREYWEQLQPSTGRPYSASLSKPTGWDVTAGHPLLQQRYADVSTPELEDILEVKQSF